MHTERYCSDRAKSRSDRFGVDCGRGDARSNPRGLYCYDAKCIEACPTGIDVPSHIRETTSGYPLGSAHAIRTNSSSLTSIWTRHVRSSTRGNLSAIVAPTYTARSLTISLYETRFKSHSCVGGHYPGCDRCFRTVCRKDRERINGSRAHHQKVFGVWTDPRLRPTR
ncbi:MAG: hypothetical protein IPP63_11470 [Chloracidobacterium sp.]|nr:hypothetical protein [Chloracidobacterium sp.]